MSIRAFEPIIWYMFIYYILYINFMYKYVTRSTNILNIYVPNSNTIQEYETLMFNVPIWVFTVVWCNAMQCISTVTKHQLLDLNKMNFSLLLSKKQELWLHVGINVLLSYYLCFMWYTSCASFSSIIIHTLSKFVS